MPGKVKVRILAGRNLPVMDRSSDTTDAYVEVKLGNTTFKTDVFRKSLNPQWNSEWFIFEVDDLELQDEPLQIRLMDHDTYSANDAIGKVYVDLNPLLLAPAQPLLTRASQDPSNVAGAAVMSGWLPVYDTMHGIRGEVNILVKVDLFSDFNKFRQSSCGVQFFFTPAIPTGFRCNSIIGFVEELVVNDDPEYQWIDKIRTPRASNEARQTLFSKLSGELQRRIGLKVLDQGGNGVIGYRQCFDLEGESGIAVRGIGSVVSLTKITSDTTGIGASNHSPSPLREFGSSDGTTTQRESLDDDSDFTLENLYVSIPNSSQLMPVSLVCLPKELIPTLPSQEAVLISHSKGSETNGGATGDLLHPNSSFRSRAMSSSKSKGTKTKESDKKTTKKQSLSKHLHKRSVTLMNFSSIFPLDDLQMPESSKETSTNAFERRTLSLSDKKRSKKSSKRHKSTSIQGKEGGGGPSEPSSKDKTRQLSDNKPSQAESDAESQNPKQKIWPICKKFSSLYLKHKRPPALARKAIYPCSLDVLGQKNVPYMKQVGSNNPFDADNVTIEEGVELEKHDIEITNIECFYSGIHYSSSDPTLNRSYHLKDKIKDFYFKKEPPLEIVSLDKEPQCSEGNTESGLPSSSTTELTPRSHHAFYLSDSDFSSSSSSSKSLDKTIVKVDDQFLGKPSSMMMEDENKAEVCPPRVFLSPEANVSSLDLEGFLSSPMSESRRGSLLKGSLLHASPGSMPDIRLVPCSPSPSSSKPRTPNSIPELRKIEDSLFEEIAEPSRPVRLHTPLSKPSSSFPLLSPANKVWTSLVFPPVCSSSSLKSIPPPQCMQSNGRTPSSPANAFGILPCHSLLCIMPAESLLYPSLTISSRSLSHPVSLPSHVSSHSLADPNAEISSRSGLSPSTVSPKRASRSRKTSGSYSLSRSPQLQEGPGESTGAPPSTTSQSPTNSVKITSPSHASGMFFNRRSSDSDISITPKGGSLTGSGGSSAGKGFVQGVQGPLGSLQKPLMSRESFDNLIYPFLTMKSFPPNFIIHLGGTVSARSVKLLDRSHLPEEMDSRDSWWAELRTEIRSHARSIACNVVLGYEEFTTICDEVCVLNASGTAAVINICPQEMDSFPGMTSKISKDPFSASLERKDADQLPVTKTVSKESQVSLRIKASSPRPLKRLIQQQNAVCRSHPNVIEDVGGEGSGGNILTGVMKLPSQLPPSTRPPPAPCTMCHIPYMENANPFNVNILKCSVCRKGKVPDVLLTTLELPATIPVTGRGCLIQARVVRAKKDLKGELNAKEISDSLPFLEYELHKQLYQKIMMKGMNSLFGLRVRVTVGERWVVGIGTGTAVYLTALPAPSMPRVVISGTGIEVEKRRSEMQKKIQDTFDKNKETFGLKFTVESQGDNCRNLSESKSSDTEDSEEELLEIDLSSGNKDAYVLDLDDLEDLEMINLLLEGSTPPHLIAVSTQTPPGLPLEQTVNNLQMFTRVWRGKIPLTLSHSVFSSLFEGLLQSIYFKVRNLSPCIIAGLKVDVELPEEDEVQISVLGMVLGQGQPPFVKSTSCSSQVAAALKRQLRESVDLKKGKVDDSSELMFTMEEVGREGEDKAIPVQPLKAPSFVTHSCNMIANAIHRSTSSSQSFPSVPSVASISSGTSSTRSSFKVRTGERQPIIYHQPLKGDHFGVEITPLSFVPGAKIERYLGNLNFFFIRESTSIKEYGGLSGFMGSFVTEVLALVRAHVAAVGGNAMISYFLSECVLLHNPHKNQAQCLINVGGDIVQVTYCIASQVQEATESTPQQVATNVAESTAGVNSIISE